MEIYVYINEQILTRELIFYFYTKRLQFTHCIFDITHNNFHQDNVEVIKMVIYYKQLAVNC